MLKRLKFLRIGLIKRKYKYLFAVLIIIGATAGFFSFVFPSVPAQSAETRLPNLASATAGQKVLVFSPHPDDETIAAGGYIAQSIKNGADVKIVLVTNGNSLGQETIRYAEFKTATAILGVPKDNLVFLGLPDSKLDSYSQIKLQAALRNQIDLFQPNIIIYPSSQDYNSDHSTIGRAMETVLSSEPSKFTEYEYLVHYKILYPRPYAFKFEPQLYILPPNELTENGEKWLSFQLPTSIENKKENALMVYQSQLQNIRLDGLLHSFIRKNELFSITY